MIAPVFDPQEGVGPGGEIRTGADRSRVGDVFEPVLAACVRGISEVDALASTYVYGSVATGTARLGTSDVDVLAVGLPLDPARALQRKLSEQFRSLCRGVEIAVGSQEDFLGDGDQAYGGRVFLRHYCVYLAGPELNLGMNAFPADARAVRGFNGDIRSSRDAWVDAARNATVTGAPEPGVLGRRVARKTLLAVAGLVSVHDATWTTDRGLAARRWGQVRPAQVDGLEQLLSWSEGETTANWKQLKAALSAGAIIDLVADDFRDMVGLWP